MAAMTVDLGSAEVIEEKDASLYCALRVSGNGPAGRKRCTQLLLQGLDGEPHTKVIFTTCRAAFAQCRVTIDGAFIEYPEVLSWILTCKGNLFMLLP